ncbi:MAG: sulfatase family protein [Planctomycetota bacterium]
MNRQPNILWIMADQFNANCLGTAGRAVKTPNLDLLQKDGVRFDRAYCNNPICSPSRITFITGQYPCNHKLLGNDNFDFEESNKNSLSALFRSNGYQTALIGKSHMVGLWDREGFEYIRYCDLCDSDPDDPMSVDYFKYLHSHSLADDYDLGTHPAGHPGADRTAFVSTIPKKHCVETWTGDEALHFLEKRDVNRPFFMHLSFQRPHPPLTVPSDSGLLYNPDEIVLPESTADLFENKFKGHHPAMEQCFDKVHGCPYRPRDKKELRRQLAFYYSLITYIDEQIGRVLNFLKESGDYDNTVIVFTSDHGDFAGEHGLILKNLGIFESLHRIPFIITYPSCPAGKVIDKIVESVDMYPTVCELAAIDVPSCVDGRSMLDIIENNAPGRAETICEWDFIEHYNCKVNAIRTSHYRLVYFNSEQGGELYDLAKDPGEMYNLYNKPEYEDIRAELMAKLAGYMIEDNFKTTFKSDQLLHQQKKHRPSRMIHTECKKWSQVKSLRKPSSPE